MTVPGARRAGAPLRLLTAAAAALASLLLVPVPGTAQAFEDEIRTVQERVEAARAEGLHLVAPRHYERARERLAEARERYERGEPIRSARESLDAARDAVAEAERLREPGRALFGEALSARASALGADAPDRAAEAWAAAEETMREGGRRLERGDREGAAARATLAASQYREAELQAIRSDVLGRARELRSRALKDRADEWAPTTFTEGAELLERADRVLTGDRTRLAEAGRLGEAAARAFLRAARIAATLDSLREDRLSYEKVARRHEAALARIAEQLRFEPDLASGVDSVAEEALAAIRSLQEDRANLQSELAQREAELADARTRIDELDDRLSGLERREAELAAELRERQRREARLREARAIFQPEEAEVVLRGDSLVVRLYALTFDTGSDEVRPEHFSLLTKLQRVLREFPAARVTIEGHTDARGDEDANRALSQRRAIAVREHLLANMPISSARIAAVGYGEARPIASNDNAEGREKNRRIEVILDLSEAASPPR